MRPASMPCRSDTSGPPERAACRAPCCTRPIRARRRCLRCECARPGWREAPESSRRASRADRRAARSDRNRNTPCARSASRARSTAAIESRMFGPLRASAPAGAARLGPRRRRFLRGGGARRRRRRRWRRRFRLPSRKLSPARISTFVERAAVLFTPTTGGNPNVAAVGFSTYSHDAVEPKRERCRPSMNAKAAAVRRRRNRCGPRSAGRPTPRLEQ